jgi:hypothetical protein
MTATLDGDQAPDLTAAAGLLPDKGPGARCAEEGCPNVVPEGAHRLRQYCDEHSGAKEARKRERRQARQRSKTNTIRVDLGGKPAKGGTDAELEAVRKRATQMAQTAAAVVLMTTRDETDAMAIAAGAERWGAAVAGVAEYEPWLRKLAAGGEASGRVLAWLQLTIATGGIVVPILAHHDLLPPQMVQLLASNIMDTAGVPATPAEAAAYAAADAAFADFDAAAPPAA